MSRTVSYRPMMMPKGFETARWVDVLNVSDPNGSRGVDLNQGNRKSRSLDEQLRGYFRVHWSTSYAEVFAGWNISYGQRWRRRRPRCARQFERRQLGRCCEATQMRGGGQEQRRIMDNKRCAGGQRRENLANNRSARGRACKTLSITLFEDVGDDRVWLLTADQSRGRVELILSASRSA